MIAANICAFRDSLRVFSFFVVIGGRGVFVLFFNVLRFRILTNINLVKKKLQVGFFWWWWVLFLYGGTSILC